MFHVGYGSGIWSDEVGTFRLPSVGYHGQRTRLGGSVIKAFLFDGVGIGKDLQGKFNHLGILFQRSGTLF